MSRSLPVFVSRRLFMSAAAALCVSKGAQASEKKAEAGDPSIRLATVGIPVTENKNVVNYLFLSVRINLMPMAPEGKFRDMEPYFRDVLVRTAHKTSFGQKDHSDRLDEPRFKTTMMAEFSKITGPGVIKSIDILSQNPKRHLG